ncbi:MAG: hypothetical protein HYZ17_05450 [Betaproteobacteria bacterium]|nr:hypothetical protein [Betaproteobacteria bacterium]
MEYQAPTAALAGKKITLAWVAATEEDQQAIEALLPKPHPDGTPIQPEELPQGLPASIRLKLEIRVNGETKATGPALTAGSEPIGAGAFSNYFDLTTWDETTDLLVAGQQSALGLSVQGVSKTQLATLKTRLEETKQKLEAAQAAPENQRAALLQGLSAEHLTGDMLTANIWSYFAAHEAQGRVAGVQAGVIELPGLSYGLFHAAAEVQLRFGAYVTGVTFRGVLMDVGHLRHSAWVKNDDPKAPINNKPSLTANGRSAAQNRWGIYNRTRGQGASVLEGIIPERLFIDRSKCRYVNPNTTPPTVVNPTLPDCPRAITAVSAQAIAQAEGQKLYTLTEKNAAVALPKISASVEVRAAVTDALAVGKEVTIHERPIEVDGWRGTGYIVIDPQTGAGAYLIEGGARGGFFEKVGIAVMSLIGAFQKAEPALPAAAALLLLLAFGPVGAVLSLVVSGLALIADALSLLQNASNPCELAISAIVGGLLLITFAFALAAPGVGWAFAMAGAGYMLSWLVSENWVAGVCRVTGKVGRLRKAW